MNKMALSLALIASVIMVPVTSLSSVTELGRLSDHLVIYPGEIGGSQEYTLRMKIKDASITLGKLAIPITISIYTAKLLSRS